jgi:hypothetical protein
MSFYSSGFHYYEVRFILAMALELAILDGIIPLLWIFDRQHIIAGVCSRVKPLIS